MSASNRYSAAANRRPAHAAAFLLLMAFPLVSACIETPAAELAKGGVPSAPSSPSYGAPVQVGNGEARTYVMMQADRVVEVGVAFTEQAMFGLPAGHGDHGEDATMAPVFVPHVLEMPRGNLTPYRFVGLDWNPDGHEPHGIYGSPHFDFHFFTISRAERDAIVPADPHYAEKAANFPAPELIPAGYVDASALMGVEPGAAAVPLMGMHWLDTSSPELNGEPFSKTFIVGSWDGDVIFYEPMITRDFLMTKPNHARALPTAKQGKMPSAYRVYWNAPTREYRVALEG
ncbi:MAG: hypothetical protein WD031_00635 [Gemmatimonadota bacterium]